MACNENIIKNMANEVTRNCLAQNCAVDSEFVVYLINLLLLNPKYGKLFSNTLRRNNLEYFVNECVSMLLRGETSLNTLKMQHIIQTNYDKLQNLIDAHRDSIESCLRPLLQEILDEDLKPGAESHSRKLFRKISIYIILASGLGNPGVITTLKEGMAALESVFSLDDLKVFVALPRAEKKEQLTELVAIVSGVRLFNRDCRKGGDTIPDLPHDLVDAGKACLTSLSNSLITVMQRVNMLTSAVEDTTVIREDTGSVEVDIPAGVDLDVNSYKLVFELLAFNRQYEVFIRKLLSDIELMVQNSVLFVERFKQVLEEIHSVVKYKAAVPVITVFPLFTRLWHVWQAMQNEMYLLSTVNKLMGTLANIQEHTKIPHPLLDKMLAGKAIVTDQERMRAEVNLTERLSLDSLRNYLSSDDLTSTSAMDSKQRTKLVQYLGFCAMCLCVGALVPSNPKVGTIKCKGRRYGFCNVNMAKKFSKDPNRYTFEIVHHARNNPHLINLLDIADQVLELRDEERSTVHHTRTLESLDKHVQTDLHPLESHVVRDYTWNLWEWKRRACHWANIVRCATHSTQTQHSHLRADTHCQTIEPRDKSLQTRRDAGVSAAESLSAQWGLRARLARGLTTTADSTAAQQQVAPSVQTWRALGPSTVPPLYSNQ